ncbi:MAG: hypothetical protein ACAI43_01560 [Phycisphaerae bacterium]
MSSMLPRRNSPFRTATPARPAVRAAAAKAARSMVEPLEGRQMLAADLFTQTAAAIARDSDGRVYVAGMQSETGQVVVARYLAPSANAGDALQLDNSFDGDGIAVLSADASPTLVTDMAVSGSGASLRVYLTGGKYNADFTGIDAGVTIVTPGTAHGATTADLHLADLVGTDEIARAIAVDANGAIVIGGTSGGLLGAGNFVARFTAAGALDPTFNEGAGYRADIVGADNAGSDINDLVIDGTTIYAAGWAYENGNQSLALSTYGDTGAPSTVVTTLYAPGDIFTQSAGLTAVALDGGRVIAAGTVDGFNTVVATYDAGALEEVIRVDASITPAALAATTVGADAGFLIAGKDASFTASASVLRVVDSGLGWTLDETFAPGGLISVPEVDMNAGGGAYVDPATQDVVIAGTQYVDDARLQDMATVRFTTGTPGAAGPVAVLDMSVDGEGGGDPDPVVAPVTVDLGADTAGHTVEVTVTDGVYQAWVDGQKFGPATLATAVSITTGSGADRITLGAGVATSIFVNSGDGDDVIEIDATVTAPAEIHAGAGKDLVISGAGSDSIFGDADDDVISAGDGNDTVNGGDGQDVGIGGKGADSLVGNEQSDLLVAAYTTHDRDAVKLKEILATWADPTKSYEIRVTTLRTGLLTPYETQGNKLLNSGTVFDDGVADILIGSAGTDWFMVNTTQAGEKDITDAARTEIRTDLDPLR